MDGVSSEVFQIHTMNHQRPCNVVRAVNDGDVMRMGGDDALLGVLNTDPSWMRQAVKYSSYSNQQMTGAQQIPGGRFALWRPGTLLQMDCNEFLNW